MTERHFVATRQGNQELRTGMQTGYGGFGSPAYIDPASVPPPNMGSTSRAGVTVTAHSLLLVDVVFTALRIISNTIIKMGDLWPYADAFSDDNIPYRKYQRTNYPILTDTFGGGTEGGRGGAMMQCTGRDRTVWSMALMGEAFWYVLDRDERVKSYGLPTAVEVLHPAFMEVRVSDGIAGANNQAAIAPKGATQFIYGTGSNRQELDPDDVIHIPFKSLPQARRALNPVTYAGVAGALAMAAYEFGSTWFSQGASPSFLLSTDQKLGTAEVERIAQKFQIEHSGLQAAHLPLVVDSGLNVQKISSTPDEAQYLHTLEYGRNVLASWFGLPPTMLGNALERQTPQPAHTSEEEVNKFLQFTLSGYTVPMEEAHAGLLPKGVKACFNEAALSKPDSQFLSQLIMALRQSQTMTQNELRTRYLQLGPAAGGDVIDKPLASNTDQSAAPGGPDAPKAKAPSAAKDADTDETKAVRTLLRIVGGDQEERSKDRSIVVNVPEREVHVAPANVKVDNHVQPATVENRVEVQPQPTPIEVKSPNVIVRNEVETPEVNVEVQPADVVVSEKSGKSTKKIVRDHRGRISGIEEE